MSTMSASNSGKKRSSSGGSIRSSDRNSTSTDPLMQRTDSYVGLTVDLPQRPVKKEKFSIGKVDIRALVQSETITIGGTANGGRADTGSGSGSSSGTRVGTAAGSPSRRRPGAPAAASDASPSTGAAAATSVTRSRPRSPADPDSALQWDKGALPKATPGENSPLRDETNPTQMYNETRETQPPVIMNKLANGGGFIVPKTPNAPGPEFTAGKLTGRSPRTAKLLLDQEPHPSNLGSELESSGSAFSLQRPYTRVGLNASIVMFSILGALIREWLSALSAHDMFAVFPRLYPNLVGCMIMGPLLMYKAFMISEHYALYIGLGVGLCGSITSFSAWQVEANQALVNWPGGVYAEYDTATDQIIGSITIQIIGFTVALGGLAFGMLATRLVSDRDYAFDVTKPPRGKITARDVALVTACGLTVFISLMVTGLTGHWKRFFVCLFAPMGTITRYQLSKKFNTTWFPRGTLIANTIGTIISAICVIVHTEYNLSADAEAVVYGIAYGFSGCLTTVSTFALELRGLASVPSRAVKYAALSVVLAQLILMLICGSYKFANQ